MPVEMKLWCLNGDKLHELATTAPDTEGDLEDWIAEDISLLADDLLIIGRQLTEFHGGRLDLLAIDPAGDLVVIELKRDRTPREVMTQALQYAAWARTLSWDEVSAIAAEHLDRSLEEVFKETFEEDLPETVNSNHRIMIVAAEMDPVTEAIVTYLAEEGNLARIIHEDEFAGGLVRV